MFLDALRNSLYGREIVTIASCCIAKYGGTLKDIATNILDMLLLVVETVGAVMLARQPELDILTDMLLRRGTCRTFNVFETCLQSSLELCNNPPPPPRVPHFTTRIPSLQPESPLHNPQAFPESPLCNRLRRLLNKPIN